MHVQSQFLLGLCVVGGLLNSADDKVACQTREKANTSDSGSIYILLCNSADLFSTICLLTAERNHKNSIVAVLQYIDLLRRRQNADE